MTKKTTSLQSPLGRIRALGPAHSGTEHWWLQRLTALALIPLTVYPLATFFIYAIYGGYHATVQWLHKPYAAGAVVLFLFVGLHHAVSGLQVIIEDYVHGEVVKTGSIIAVKFIAVALAVIGCLATLKIMLGV